MKITDKIMNLKLPEATTIGLFANYVLLSLFVIFSDEKKLLENIILPLTGIFIFSMLEISSAISQKQIVVLTKNDEFSNS